MRDVKKSHPRASTHYDLCTPPSPQPTTTASIMFTIRHAAARAVAIASRRAPLAQTTTISRQFSIAAPRAFARTWIVRDQERPLEPLEETTKPGVESGVKLESEAKLAEALENPAPGTTEAEVKPAAEAHESFSPVALSPEEKQARTAAINDEKKRTLFVQNISWDVTEESIREDFASFGEIETIFRAGGRATWCMITFTKAEAMHEAAEQVNGTFWHGRRITAVPRRADEEKREPRQKFQRRERTMKAPTPYLYVGNMPYDISDAELTGIFDSVENATGVRIATDPSTGMPRGYAHIDFRSVADAEKAFETFSQIKIRERQLIVDYAEKREQSKRRPPVNRSRSEDWSKRD